jgi:hypothetical protein
MRNTRLDINNIMGTLMNLKKNTKITWTDGGG